MSLLLAFQDPNIISPLPAATVVGAYPLASLPVQMFPGTAGAQLGAAAPAMALGAVGFDNLADRLTSTTVLTQADSFSACGWVNVDAACADPGFFFEFDGAGFGWGLAYSGGHLLLINESGFGTLIDLGAVTFGSYVFVALSNLSTAGNAFVGTESTAVGTAITGTLPASASLIRTNIGGASASSHPGTGAMSQWRAWNGVQLSQSEFEAERTSAVAVRTSGLVADWPLFSTASKLVDASGSGNALATTGAGPWTEQVGPVISSAGTLTPSTAGVTVGGVAPSTLQVTTSPGTAGATVGANAPVLSVQVAPGTAGMTLAANAPVLGVNVAPSTAGVTVGAVAPGLAVSLAAGTAGAVVGGVVPSTLAVNVSPSTAGITCGAVAPSLTFGSASLSPATAGVTAGANAPTLAVNLQPSAAGAVLGAAAPSLLTALTPATAGVIIGAQQPALPVAISPASAGVTVGANALAALLVNLQPSPAGLVISANAAAMATSFFNAPAAGLTVGANAPRLFNGYHDAGAGLTRPKRSVSIV